ncbi:DUF5793 family protein [Halobacteriales archaeon Cl-PHB]
MRRDYFTLHVRNVPPEESAVPTLVVTYDGPSDELTAHLLDEDGETIPAAALDVACRLREDDHSDTCVLSLTHRVTGEYLVEINGDADAIRSLVEAARDCDKEPAYRVRIERPDADPVVYDKRTLLVYDEDGDLLRGDSLIPSGVEL